MVNAPKTKILTSEFEARLRGSYCETAHGYTELLFGLCFLANQAAATDLASVITLANELRAALVEKRLVKGSA